MGTRTLHIDIAIIGGGIAGLWALNQLRNHGYSAVLFEEKALGSDQTIGSQGIIHGGIKYTLSGSLGKGSEAIAAMPATWRKCLSGNGEVDLRACKVLSEHFYLWSNAGLSSRLSGFLASKLLRGRVDKLAAENYPGPFQSPDFQGQVFRLDDLVLDTPSLLQTLAAGHRDAIYSIDWNRATLERDAGNANLVLPGCTVIPQRLLLTAGAGNAGLMAQLGSDSPAMQKRPLQQVVVKHQYQQPLFAHCLGSKPSPRLTISSHHCSDGGAVWYLGGDIATDGADDPPQQLISRAQQELAEVLPWIDLGPAQWRTLTLDRAEPLQATLLRPDAAFVKAVPGVNNTLVAWPTKLSLCPDLGKAIQKELDAAGIQPIHGADLSMLQPLGQPAIASNLWDTLFQ